MPRKAKIPEFPITITDPAPPPTPGTDLWELIGTLPMTETGRARYDVYSEMPGDHVPAFLKWYFTHGCVRGDDGEVESLKRALAAAQATPAPAPDRALEREVAQLRAIVAQVAKERDTPRRTNGFKTLAL